MAKAEVKEAPAKKKAAAKEDGPKMLTTKDIAERFGTKPATLRRFLRTLPANQDDGYTRYKFDPADTKALKDLEASFGKYKTAEKEKNAERLKNLKKDDKAKGGKKTASKKSKDEDDEEEEEEIE